MGGYATAAAAAKSGGECERETGSKACPCPCPTLTTAVLRSEGERLGPLTSTPEGVLVPLLDVVSPTAGYAYGLKGSRILVIGVPSSKY